jgi:hypothetical protein
VTKPDEPRDVVNRLRGTFLEIPGTKLTADQASRLCGIASQQCERILVDLTASGFLVACSDGSFVRPG